MEEEKLIFAISTGKPFQNEKAATIQRTKLLRENPPVHTKVIAVEGGFALKRLYQKRPTRIPMGKRRILSFDPIPGYELRVFNDKPDNMGQRLRDAEAAGYEYVIDPRKESQLEDERAGKTSPMGSAVTKPVGGGVTGVLMKKKKEWVEEDEQLKQDKIDQQEAELKSAAGVDGRYGSIKIGNKPEY